MKKYIIIILLFVGLFGVFNLVKSNNSTNLIYREFDLDDSCGIKRFVDPDNGNVCYVTNACGYKGLSISCLK